MTWNLALWLLLLGLGLMLEGAGLASAHDKWEPATYYIRRWVPKAIIAIVLVWLGHHFGVTP